jgi:hypothetical protein
MLTLMYFERKLNFIETHKNTYTGSFSIIDPEYGGVTTKKYRVSVSFCCELSIFDKTLWILNEKLNFLKTHKKLRYETIMYIWSRIWETQPRNMVFWSCFCYILAIFGTNRSLTPMDFEQKLKFFKTCKNSYTRTLCITVLEYESHGQEI